MNVSQTVVTGIVMVVVISLLSAIIMLIVPLYKHYEFTTICRTYGLNMELDNGLSEDNLLNLTEELRYLGMESIEIDAPKPYAVAFNTYMPYKVKGTFSYGIFESLFSIKKQNLVFSFETRILSRKIAN